MRRNSTLPTLLAGVLALLLSLGISTFLVFRPQDLRNQAAEPGKAEITVEPSSSSLAPNSLSTLSVYANTNGQAVDSIQAVFDVKTSTTDRMTLRVYEPSGLRRVWERVDNIDGGKRMNVALITRNPTKPFISNGKTKIADVIFTPQSVGAVSLDFNDGLTSIFPNKEARDISGSLPNRTVSIAVPDKKTTTPTKKTTTTAARTTTSRYTKITQSSLGGKTATGQQTASAQAKADDGIGGSEAIAAQCNVSCSSSAECGYGFLCYENQCRRIGNATSETCEANDTLFTQACNDVCQETSQCYLGLICYNGTCRNSDNPESSACTVAASENKTIAESCNQRCFINADCGAGLACYQGMCRLPSVPTNADCSDPEDPAERMLLADSDFVAVRQSGDVVAPQESQKPKTNWSRVIALGIGAIALIGTVIGGGYFGIQYWREKQEEKRLTSLPTYGDPTNGSSEML